MVLKILGPVAVFDACCLFYAFLGSRLKICILDSIVVKFIFKFYGHGEIFLVFFFLIENGSSKC